MISKLERLCIILLWLIIMIIYANLIFPSGFEIFDVKIQSVISSTIITVIIYCVYCKIRNHHIRKKIHKNLFLNQYDECIMYIDKCIVKQQKTWLKFEKLMVLGLKGCISDFQAYSNEIKDINSYVLKKYCIKINMIEQLFSYVMNRNIPKNVDISKPSTYLEKTILLLSELESLDSSDVIKRASNIYNTPYSLFKCVSALILCKEYKKSKDYINAQLYALKAKEYSPSQEIKFCIANHLGD